MVSQGCAPSDTVEKSSAAEKYLNKCGKDARGYALSMVQSAAMSSTQNAALALYSESGDVAVFKLFHTPAAAVQFLEAAKSRQSSLLVRDTVCWECIRVMAEEDVSVDKAMHQVCPEWNGDKTRNSQLKQAVHKNLRHLVCIGEHLVTTFSVLSHTELCKKKRKGWKRNRNEDPIDEDQADPVEQEGTRPAEDKQQAAFVVPGTCLSRAFIKYGGRNPTAV